MASIVSSDFDTNVVCFYFICHYLIQDELEGSLQFFMEEDLPGVVFCYMNFCFVFCKFIDVPLVLVSEVAVSSPGLLKCLLGVTME